MADTLNIKIEKILKAYLDDSNIVNVNFYEGHTDSAVCDLPSMTVMANAVQPAADMPAEINIKSVNVVFELRVDSVMDDAKVFLDATLEEIESTLSDTASILAYSLAPSSLPETRAITDVHLYDMLPDNESTGFDRTQWKRELSFNVICQNYDNLTE